MLPPRVDRNGYGLRVPAMVISPYARRGFIDHQTLSFDAYNKFIEDDFLNGQRLDPATDGRPDPRPDVRESNPAAREPRTRLQLQAEASVADNPSCLSGDRPAALTVLLTRWVARGDVQANRGAWAAPGLGLVTCEPGRIRERSG